MRKIPLLITSSVIATDPNTKMNNSKLRLQLLIESIELWMMTPGISGIVVCDGSGFVIEEHMLANKINKNSNIQCEFINFKNNSESVALLGKGFGEGEIINYAIKNSKILANADIFAKCTGRLWVENFEKCLKRYNGFAKFDVMGIFKPKLVDTRFYIVEKEFYIKNLSKLYLNVNDKHKNYLEM